MREGAITAAFAPPALVSVTMPSSFADATQPVVFKPNRNDCCESAGAVRKTTESS